MMTLAELYINCNKLQYITIYSAVSKFIYYKISNCLSDMDLL